MFEYNGESARKRLNRSIEVSEEGLAWLSGGLGEWRAGPTKASVLRDKFNKPGCYRSEPMTSRTILDEFGKRFVRAHGSIGAFMAKDQREI